MKNSNVKIYFSLIALSVFMFASFPEQASADFFEFEFLEKWNKIDKAGSQRASTIHANLALLCLLIASVYPLTKLIMRKQGASESELSDRLSGFLSIHIIAGMFTFLFTMLHAHYADATSVYFIVSIIVIFGMLCLGVMLRYVPNLDEIQIYNLLRGKRIMFYIFLFLTVLGHILVCD